nr:SRPBCC family protein [uncultured Actinoplanes sp.]
MANLNHYHFTTVWRLTFPPGEVFAVLADLGSYTAWWPGMRRIDRVDATAYETEVRSVLPFSLVFRTVTTRQDRQAGVLQADLRGDLEGFSRWTVAAEDGGARATFEEEVIARNRLLRVLAPVARPVFRWNHAVLMNRGERGLRVFLAGRSSAGQ